jgi:MFS family permease
MGRVLTIPRPFAGVQREVVVLAAVAFAVAAGFGIMAPAIPEFAQDFGVGETAATGVVSIFALMRLLSALRAGRLVEKLGERVVLAAGIGIVAVSSALAGASQTYGQLLVLRGIGGVGSVMFTVSAMSLLIRSVSSEARGRATGMFSGGFLLGGMAGPSLSGPVIDISLRAPFFIYAATLAVAGSIGLLALPRRELAVRDDAPGAGTSVRQALRQPAYRAALATYAAEALAAFGVRFSLVPLLAKNELGLSSTAVGVGLTVGAVVNAVMLAPVSRYADRRGRRPLLLAGCAFAAVGMLTLVVVPSLGGYVGGLAVFGVGSAMLSVAPAAVLGDVVRGRSGQAVAAYGMAGDLAAFVGPLVAAALAERFGYGAGFGFVAATLVAAMLVALRSPETRRVESPVPQPERA